jgi:hypothetical protein
MGASMRTVLVLIFVVLCCPSVYAESDEFPDQIRGFWAIKKETCDALKKLGPARLRADQAWLKIAANDVLGSIQGRYFGETTKKYVLPADGVMSFEFQPIGRRGEMEQLTLSRDGYLYETIVGFLASAKYQRC